MIHLLEVGPNLLPKELKKLSRRYAMTGGYELGLESNLSSEDLDTIANNYLPQLDSYESDNSERRSSNAFRILSLVFSHPDTQVELKGKIKAKLG